MMLILLVDYEMKKFVMVLLNSIDTSFFVFKWNDRIQTNDN